MAEGYPHVFVKPPSEDLRWKCHVCQGILRKPVLVTCCGGKFCSTCINEWRGRENYQCPLCRGQYDLAPEKDLERVLLDKEVLCSHQNQGCQWRGELRKVEEHEKNECQYVSIDCPYECGVKVLRLNMEPYKYKCPNKPQPCEFAIYGCQQMVQFNKKKEHCASHSKQHLTLVLSELKKKEKELELAKKDVISNQTKLEQIKRQVRETKECYMGTEKVLQQTKEELCREQERCKKSDTSLEQTKRVLQQAKRDVVDTQIMLHK